VLINFIGSPCSGKTTTAASLFAKLKEDSHLAEFIPEQARHYIATLRFNEQLAPSEPIQLDDSDQYKIMEKQSTLERIITIASGSDVVVVSDSSVLNALLYMTDENKQSFLTQALVFQAMQRVDLFFYCPPVESLLIHNDPNRVHSAEESLAIDKKIPDLMAKYIPADKQITLLSGSSFQRLHAATHALYERMLDC
jgi:hypothetical protein